MAKPKKNQREVADTNIRIWKSTHKVVSEIARGEGKSIPRILDEKFNPTKYQTNG